ncbi:MAG: thiol-disulfide oxidoreductase DCC family protein [Bacteroidota bacterium]
MGTDHKIEYRNIIFFDGVCNLCNGAINFIIDHDKRNTYSFSSLQSEFAQSALTDRDVNPKALNTIILIDENGKTHIKSNAVLRVASNLGGGWKWLGYLQFIPRFIRDFFYDLVAKSRYSLFGRKDRCRIPTPELRQRFLDAY